MTPDSRPFATPAELTTARGRSESAGPISLAGRPLWGYQPADVVVMTYLAAVCAIIAVGHARLPFWAPILLAHLALLAGIGLLRLAPRNPPQPLQFLRESYPLWLMAAAYLELGRIDLALTGRYHDVWVLRLDQAFFGTHPNAWLASRFSYPPLSEFLHFCYLFYILLVPILGLTLYFQRRVHVFRVFATTAALTMYSCYLTFMLFPVQGPYYTFPRLHLTGFFPGLVQAYLQNGAAVGAAFPSSHVAGAIMVAVMAHRFSRRLSYALILLALGIAVGTVYGGFHYAIDSLTGLVFGLLTAFLGPRLHAALLRRIRLAHIRFRFPHLRLGPTRDAARAREMTGQRPAGIGSQRSASRRRQPN